jgi:hypothetical protein
MAEHVCCNNCALPIRSVGWVRVSTSR